jgi:hypothetical protein
LSIGALIFDISAPTGLDGFAGIPGYGARTIAARDWRSSRK